MWEGWICPSFPAGAVDKSPTQQPWSSLPPYPWAQARQLPPSTEGELSTGAAAGLLHRTHPAALEKQSHPDCAGLLAWMPGKHWRHDRQH